MKSVARIHFPRVILKNRQKWLFNPVLKKRYANRPEERVRLAWVEYLLHETDWKKTRIGFETPVSVRQTAHRLRADLILYDKNLKPFALVECKSPSVALNTSTAEQAARYNIGIEASYIILTNGVRDYCFRIGEGDPARASLPFPENRHNGFQEKLTYWAERGFATIHPRYPVFNHWLQQALPCFWTKPNTESVRYLAFENSYLPVPMEHYYKIFTLDHTTRLAVTFLGDGESDTYLLAVLNRQGHNRGVVTIRLNGYTEQKDDCIRCYFEEKEVRGNPEHLSGLHFSAFSEEQILNLPGLLMKFFD